MSSVRAAAVRARRAAVRAIGKAEAAERMERAEEELAPGIQRRGVAAGDGNVLWVGRVVRDGVSYRVGNPLERMLSHGGEGGITRAHVRAAERLRTAWETGGAGVGMGARWYGERTSGGIGSGTIGEHILAVLGAQNRARDECTGAVRWLRGGWGVVRSVVLEGMDLGCWGRQQGRNPQVAKGYLLAALDELVAYYERVDGAAGTGRARIRGVEVVGRAGKSAG